MTEAGATATVTSPASSANLGPGFDAFGLALAWYDEAAAEVLSSGLDIVVEGEGASEVPRDERHLVVRAVRATFDLLGVPQPGLRLRCRNRIPHGRGLGSSASAIVSGIRLAGALADGASGLDDVAALALATELEGHPDNVAACLFGGFTIAWSEPDGPRVVRLTVDQTIVPTVFVPPHALSTEAARGLLPEQVAHRDASANAGRAALTVAALTQRPDLLLAATEDRLHQSYRSPAMPESAALVDELRGAGFAATVSGAGPTVLVLASADQTPDPAAWAPTGWQGRRLELDPRGARVVG